VVVLLHFRWFTPVLLLIQKPVDAVSNPTSHRIKPRGSVHSIHAASATRSCSRNPINELAAGIQPPVQSPVERIGTAL